MRDIAKIVCVCIAIASMFMPISGGTLTLVFVMLLVALFV